jgi:hypothetical protein
MSLVESQQEKEFAPSALWRTLPDPPQKINLADSSGENFRVQVQTFREGSRPASEVDPKF